MTEQEAIAEITRRLVEFYRPVRVYLFGSEARGDPGADSDLDFCVVLPDDAPQSLYRDRSIHRQFRVSKPRWTWSACPAATSTPAPPTSSPRSPPPWSAKGSSSMTSNELPRNEAAKWLRQAARDRNAAQVLIDVEPSRSVFLSQQAAEKAAKAFLTFHQVAFRKTHDLPTK